MPKPLREDDFAPLSEPPEADATCGFSSLPSWIISCTPFPTKLVVNWLNRSNWLDFRLYLDSCPRIGLSLALPSPRLLLSAQAQIGTKNSDVTMEPYIYKKRSDGEYQLVEHFEFRSRSEIAERKGGICRDTGVTNALR
jgi:hypothetical protein